jgi:hypothetical protein
LPASHAMASLWILTTRLPFESPAPEPTPVVDTVAAIAGSAAVVALVLAVPIVGDLLSLASLPSLPGGDDGADGFDVDAALRASNADVPPPPRDERGFVECTKCSAFVPYGSMSLDESGYFCRYCAESMTQAALADLPDSTFKI